MKHRIWELDALRGICILGMVIVHLMYDLVELYQILDIAYPNWFRLLWCVGSVTFVVISGICVTLGRRSVRRGLTVFGCGLLVSAVTVGLTFLGFGEGVVIYFGVLHCLGVCMLLWPLFKKLPSWSLAVLGIALILPGLYLWEHRVAEYPYLLPLGFLPAELSTADYFPLMPNLGYFLLGAVLGRTVYREKTTRFPTLREANPIIRFLCFCGKASLPIYLLHQPILNGICMLLMKE